MRSCSAGSARLRVVLLVGAAARVASFGFTVPAGKSECFHELAKASDRLSGEWKVLSGGMMDLDVQARAAAAGPRSARPYILQLALDPRAHRSPCHPPRALRIHRPPHAVARR